MKPSALIKDDDAVSPVIGVILMVAITVILAAVIASFVLGLGDSTGEVQPNSSFSFDYDGSAITVTLSDGDTVEAGEIYIRGDIQGTDKNGNEVTLDSVTNLFNSANNPFSGPGAEWSVGQSVTFDDSLGSSSGQSLRIVWEDTDSDDAATLAEEEFDTS